MNEHVWWYVARSSGIVAWAVLALSVLVGLALSTRALGTRPAPAWLLDLHRGVGGLGVVFTGVHLLGLVLDDYVAFGFAELFVPFASAWRPGAVAWGVAALYGLVAVEVTSLLRRRLSTRTWRWVHAASFPLAVVATVHLLTAGTDTSHPLLLGAVLVFVFAAGTLTLLRIWAAHQRTARRAEKAAARSRPAAAG